MIVFPRRCALSIGMFFVIIIFFLMISRTLFSQSSQVSLAEGGMPSKRTFDRLLWFSSASSLSSSFSLWSWRFSFEVLICSKCSYIAETSYESTVCSSATSSSLVSFPSVASSRAVICAVLSICALSKRETAWVSVFICSSSSFRTGWLEAESSPDAVGVVGPGRFGSMPDIIRKASNVVTASLAAKPWARSPLILFAAVLAFLDRMVTSVAVKRPTDTLSPSAVASMVICFQLKVSYSCFVRWMLLNNAEKSAEGIYKVHKILHQNDQQNLLWHNI